MQIYYGLVCNLLCNFIALFEGSLKRTRTPSECLRTQSWRIHYNIRDKELKKLQNITCRTHS